MAELLDRLPVGPADEHLRPMILSGDGVTVSLQPRNGLILLRGGDTEEFQAKASAALGISLPLTPNSVAETADVMALWLRPGGWLLLAAPVRASALLAEIGPALAGHPHLALDVSHQYVRATVTGGGARALLSRSCTLDLRPDRFRTGDCARTRLGDVPVIIRPTGDGYDLLIEQSLARFTWWWLEELIGK